MHRGFEGRRPAWDRVGELVSKRFSWLLALIIAVIGGGLMGALGQGSSADQSPVALPPSAESAKAAALLKEFPGGGAAPVILVVTRTDGEALTPADLAAAEAARGRMVAATGTGGPPIPVTASEDGKAALAPVPVDSTLSGFALNDEVKSLREAAKAGLPGDLTTNVTGGPAFGADIANAFSGANITLLAVTGAVVALLLIITYRSPVLWLVPLLVIAFADRVAAVLGSAIAEGTGMTADGSTSGITSVLVFGAGTNYALLLISRYREELRSAPDHRAALRTAVRFAGPAIAASNATVVLALLTLLLASSPSTRSLGVQAASGLVVAAVFVLLMLPPLLALFGPKLFWPFIPRPGGEQITATGAWHRVADWVSNHAGRVTVASTAVLIVLATGLLATPVGLNQIDQFRVSADSVAGYRTLSAHFPSGLTDPTRVIGRADAGAALEEAIRTTPGVISVNPAGNSASGLSQWQVVLAAEPASDASFDTIAALRDSVHRVDPGALVGGSDAQALDAKNAAVHDRWVVIPAILIVVLAVLYILLRAALAPLILVAATVLSTMAALGLGGWVSVHLLGFPALDNTTPLFAFLFLVALGVDYTIFLVTRAREETPQHGTRGGIVRAVSATGAVITSAGIVLAAVFTVLGVLPLIVLTQLGIIVGLGILLDTFVVRTVVIPALFTLIGPAIWWPAFSRAEIEPAEGA
ncbi:MMPL family transporter [Mycolicibacterium aichiense]|uniref:Membrane protein n=1 Tax=Mycolicibacterium aichiense TaxID=1799 RepID=A0AAD1MD74_9MYCO|nr:MMPL family transporter [Mycolicibacterium aichiense]MCV7017321.1 MMPL family transporter [Mycolicibacterium aichiense]BBX10247.1 membrane protein [Mycolicibacterium aichiense]STZ26092.1 Mmpl [Mycolicibacterium aichiense]